MQKTHLLFVTTDTIFFVVSAFDTADTAAILMIMVMMMSPQKKASCDCPSDGPEIGCCCYGGGIGSRNKCNQQAFRSRQDYHTLMLTNGAD